MTTSPIFNVIILQSALFIDPFSVFVVLPPIERPETRPDPVICMFAVAPGLSGEPGVFSERRMARRSMPISPVTPQSKT